MTYIKLATESVGDAGDQYTGLDRFGRIADQRWINGSNTDVDRYQYGYDRDGNRLYKDNKVIASLSEVYTYDSLNQLASYKLGTLNSGKTDVTGSPANSQSWDYDAVGNWDSITTNSTTQTRTANKQNEITAVSGATTPTYDSNGNLTTDENNYRFVYDPWNKVVQVKNTSNVVIVTYGRDALHRHVMDTVGSTVTDRFFSSDWQVLETKVGSNTVTRNVWSPVYVDGLVLRDRDTDANGTFDERLYSLQDANWNTTGLVNAGGTVQERYTYTPFGQVTFRDGSGSTLSASAKDWVFLHQGGERIAAGDYEFRNRVYSPSLGRWLSNDPLGFDAGDQNWFRAVRNNPGNGLDPIGLDEWWFWKDPLYLVPFREQNLWGDIRNNLIPKRSKAYIESPIGQVFDPNKTDNPNPTLGSYLDADFRDSVQVTKQGMMRHVGEELAEKAAGAVAVGAAGVAAKKIYKSIKSVKAPNRVGRFPAEPYDLTKTLGVDPKVSTTQHGTRRYLWEPNQNTRIRFESHPGDSGAFNPRHHGEHYHIEIKPDGMTWNQAKKQGLITKVNPEDYIPGHGTGHLPGEPFPGQ